MRQRKGKDSRKMFQIKKATKIKRFVLLTWSRIADSNIFKYDQEIVHFILKLINRAMIGP